MNKKIDTASMAADQWLELMPEMDVLTFELGLRIRRLASILADELADVIQAQGFSVLGDYDVAAMLRRSAVPVHPRKISTQLRITASGLTGRPDRLEAAGLIRRAPDEADGRSVTIELTSSGTRRVDRTHKAVMAGQAQLLAPLEKESQHELSRCLHIILSTIDQAHLARRMAIDD